MHTDVQAWHQRLTGQLSVPLPPERAFRLFTPLGERDWVPGWEPRFPAPAQDDTQVGTAFVTQAHGSTQTWIVVEREPGRRIRYASVAPGDRASLITVELAADGTGSAVSVTYDITALGADGARRLVLFAQAYEGYLRSWREQIVAHLCG